MERKEAIEVIKKNWPDNNFTMLCDALETLIPELKESEDERIRKWCISHFKECINVIKDNDEYKEYLSNKVLAWLEKQGEQKTIWHNEDEEPQRGSLILLIMQSGNPIVAKVIEPNHTFNHGERWAYIDDLLENQGSPVLSNSSNIGKGEKCPADKVEPKFKVGDIIKPKDGGHEPWQIMQVDVFDKKYRFKDGCVIHFSQEDAYELIEQKPSNKVEPKFHEGEWVILTAGELSTTLQIVKVDTNKKLYWFNDSSYLPIVDEECLHLWTIQGAKDGDVLCSESGWTCIFKALDNHTNTFSSYCFMDNYKWFCNTGSECHTLDKAFIKAYNGEIYPATKEQCDTLLKAMADAGYTFDFEKKELKKIEQSPIEEVNGEDYGIDSLFHAQRILEKTLGKVDGYQSDDGILEHKCAITAVKKLYEHKSAEWSEEDERTYKSIIYSFNYNYPLTIQQQEFVKSLKNRVQPKQEWSEEDEKEVAVLEAYIRSNDWSDRHIDRALGIVDELVNKIKYLEPQNHWKPTEPQLASLTIACDRNDRVGFELTQLLQELKKL